MKFHDYLRILRERWLIVAACVVLVTAATAAVSQVVPPKYAANTRLFVTATAKAPPPSGIDDSYEAGLLAQKRAITYTELLTSENVLQRTIEALGLDLTTDELSGQVKPTLAPDSVLISVRVEDNSPQRAALIANNLADQLLAVVNELESTDPFSNRTATALVAQRADVPDVPFSPRKKLNVGLGMIVGLVLGMGLATLRDGRDKRVKSIQEIEDLTNSTVIAKLPRPTRRSKDANVLSGANSSTLEAYRELRTYLRFRDGANPPRSLVITSATYDEDRAFTAINFAAVLGNADATVGLVDADFRRPRVTNELDLNSNDGLSDVLAGTQPLDWSLQRSSLSGVMVLPSGPIPPNPSELLSSQTAESVFKDLCRQFDYVIFDAPPLLAYTDAALVTRQSDGAILIVQPYLTTRDSLIDAVAKLAGINARLLGAVTTPRPRRGLARFFGRSRRERPREKHRRSTAVATEKAVSTRKAVGAPTETEPV
jgi:capsular exopolysaccharide synthesis family protein